MFRKAMAKIQRGLEGSVFSFYSYFIPFYIMDQLQGIRFIGNGRTILASYRKEGYLIILYAAVAKVILTKVVNRYAGDFINLPGNVTYTYSRIGVKIW